MLGYFVTIISLLPICISVGIEYYDDKNLPEELPEDFFKLNSYKKRSGNENALINSDIWEHNITGISSTSNAAKYNISRDNFSYSTSFDRKYGTTMLNVSSIKISTIVANHTSKIFSSDTLNEYEYTYDDETGPFILRQSLPNTGQYAQINNSGPNIKGPLIEFYNLEPAVQILSFNVQHKYSKCNSVRYILEDLPCWELPILYGEFGKQKKSSEVFLMHGAELKNVIENNEEGKPRGTLKISRAPLSYYTNKWCKISPCYGDHTLCLFSDNYVSGICNEGYKVVVPDISEQTALINTLNSMRNKIANGESDRYSHLPPAANMKQMIYDYDLENFAKVWLLQCLPGPEPCSALDGTFVNQLECTKFAKFCCIKSFSAQYKKCTPKSECFTPPVIGCLHVWFWNAGDNLTLTDIQCGHSSVSSYSTTQLLWATTYKIGCAYGKETNGDVRVICNFSPGAPFILSARFYCGILNLKGGTNVPNDKNISEATFLKSFGIDMNHIIERNETKSKDVGGSEGSKLKFDEETNVLWGIETLHKIYSEDWLRKEFKNYTNGTRDMIARLVVKYIFIELNGAKCDSDDPIYVTGQPGSLCVEKGRRYHSLCYDYRDPTPGYRLVAVITPIALFSLILYDLFSGVVRQTNY